MTLFLGLDQLWQWILRTVLSVWVKPAVKPADAAAVVASCTRPVCYVLEHDSQTDLAVLNEACARLRLPRPTRRLLIGGRRAMPACFELERRAGLFGDRRDLRSPKALSSMVAAAQADASFDIDLVPVAIFWGRAANKEASWWRLLFTENWVLAGRLRKFLTVVFNGRNTLLYFGEPLRLQDFVRAEGGAARGVRRIVRVLRANLGAQRESTIGPDLSHRRTIVTQVLKTREVRCAVRARMAESGITRRAALLSAKKYADEIAADYSQALVTFASIGLGRLWNRLYDGIKTAHFDKLQEIGDGAEIIYVPCHRSHMDYLLLSYVIYHQGFAVPHIAAGVNLNMPVIGHFLRKGGAFFMRRSFKGNRLYAVVFTNYLAVMVARGHSLEYFIEGGRSRTGRLLAPRTGMLAMTVRSFLRSPRRAVVFMPVYFGYERIFEARTYIGELSGAPKRKETTLGLLMTLPALRGRFGTVHVSLGEPIRLGELLGRHNPGWREEAADAQEAGAAWIAAAIDDLAQRIVEGINSAAAVTPINLVAMAMLAAPRQALPESELLGQLELYQALLAAAPYSPLVTVCAESPAAIVDYAEKFQLLERQSHPLGDIIRMGDDSAVLATYYRNNILHLFAMPSLLACSFLSNESMTAADIHRLMGRVYPYVREELFLRWSEAELGAVTDSLLDAFRRLKLLSSNPDRSVWRRPSSTSIEGMRLSLLAAATIQTIERYYLAIALLMQAGSGRIAQDALEQRCVLMAQRMSLLYGVNSPEFFDKSLFHNFIELLRRRGVIEKSADGMLLYGDPLVAVAADAQVVLSEQIRHSILQVTLG